jgi:hypothetical protein
MPPEVPLIFALVCLVAILGLVVYTLYRTWEFERTMARIQAEASERMKTINTEHEQRLAEIRQGTSAVSLDVARTRLLADRNHAQEVVRQANERAAEVQRQMRDTMQRGLTGFVGQNLTNSIHEHIDDILNRSLQGFVSTTTTTTVSTREEANEQEQQRVLANLRRRFGDDEGQRIFNSANGVTLSDLTQEERDRLMTQEEADPVQSLPPEEALRLIGLPQDEFRAELEKMAVIEKPIEKEPENPSFWDRLNRDD